MINRCIPQCMECCSSSQCRCTLQCTLTHSQVHIVCVECCMLCCCYRNNYSTWKGKAEWQDIKLVFGGGCCNTTQMHTIHSKSIVFNVQLNLSMNPLILQLLRNQYSRIHPCPVDVMFFVMTIYQDNYFIINIISTNPSLLSCLLALKLFVLECSWREAAFYNSVFNLLDLLITLTLFRKIIIVLNRPRMCKWLVISANNQITDY